MKRRLLFLALLLPLCVAAQPIVRQGLTTNTADNPSTGQSPVWNGTKWVMAPTNQFGGSVPDPLSVNQANVGTLYVSNSVVYYASASTIILDCTYSQTHTVTQALAHHVSVIISNFGLAGRDFSFYCYGANAATNNNVTWSLASGSAGIMEWADKSTNTSCLSNGWVHVSGTVPMAMAGVRTNMVLNQLNE